MIHVLTEVQSFDQSNGMAINIQPRPPCLKYLKNCNVTKYLYSIVPIIRLNT